MLQCPDCEKTEQVIIAGKVFCVNCGAPWVPNKTDQPTSSPHKNDKPAAKIQATIITPAAETEATASSKTGKAADTTTSANASNGAKADNQTAVTTAPTQPPATTPAKPVSPVTPILPSSPLNNLPPTRQTAQPLTTASPGDKDATSIVKRDLTARLDVAQKTPKNPLVNKFHPRETSMSPSQTQQKTVTPAQPVTPPSVSPSDLNQQQPQSAPAPVPPPVSESQSYGRPIVAESAAPIKTTNDIKLVPSAPTAPISTFHDHHDTSVTPPSLSTTSTAAQQFSQLVASSPEPKTTSQPDSDYKENVGSELPSLETKEAEVLSDDQLKDLAEIKIEPALSERIETPTDSTNQPKGSPNPPATRPIDSVASARPNGQIPAQQTNPTPASTSVSPQPAHQNTATAIPRPSLNDIVVPAPQVVSNTSPFPAPAPNLAEPNSLTSQQPATASQPHSVTTPHPQAGTPSISHDLAYKMALETSLNQVSSAVSPPSQDLTKDSRLAKPAAAVLTIIAVALIGGYIWQVNYPNLALKLAANRAGVTASLPGYLPNGWHVVKNIHSELGKVSYELESANGSKRVTVDQVKSDWDSQALVENYVVLKSNDYLALQAQGLTIYIYGDNQASWINKGNWYRLEGSNHGLDQEQIIKIATSL